MKTSKEWWEDIKSDPNKLHNWLQDQYHGELTAASRIRDYITIHATDPQHIKMLEFVANQETEHAEWVGKLLLDRDMLPLYQHKVERYWEQTLPTITDLESGCAVAAHAEEMRLERIKVITTDSDCPEDIRQVFMKILPQEVGHASIFTALAGDRKGEAAEAHARGLEALGLII